MKQKILRRIKEKRITYKDIMGFDIETAGKKNEFVLACFYTEKIQVYFDTIEDVIQFLDSERVRKYTIFATNLAFDFLGTFWEHADRWKINERNGVIYSFTWYQHKGTRLKNPINFYDTLRIYPASVEQLGKLVNLPKLPHPKSFARRPKNTYEKIELIEYCMNDAKITYLFVKTILQPILEKYNIPMKSTIGSIALHDYRRNHQPFSFFQETEEKRQMAFASYYGGRTETYKRGLFKNVTCLDINSLYPSAMRNTMPNPNRSYKVKVSSLKYITHYEGVSEVLVEVPYMKIPPLPYKKNGKLIFPTGTFWGFYNHNELRNAMKYGVRILDIKQSLIYPHTTYLFKSFVEKHYTERLTYQQQKNPLQVIEKNILNNLYGKFAFNYKKTSSIVPAHAFEYDKYVKDDALLVPLCDNKFISVELPSAEPPSYSFPILSSYITSYARITMYEYLVQTQNKLIATDTDSIFLHDYQNDIETSNEVGRMKVEDGYPVEKGYFVRPKMYCTHKPKCKGVKFSDDKEEREEQFMHMLDGKPIKQERFVKYRTALRSKTHHTQGILTPNYILESEKECNLEDTKRVWSHLFQPFEMETSEPIELHHVYEELVKDDTTMQKRIREQHRFESNKHDMVHEMLKETDLFDTDVVPKEMTIREYLEQDIKDDMFER